MSGQHQDQLGSRGQGKDKRGWGGRLYSVVTVNTQIPRTRGNRDRDSPYSTSRSAVACKMTFGWRHVAWKTEEMEHADTYRLSRAQVLLF